MARTRISLPDPTERRVTVMKALAHPSRMRIAEALMKGEMCVCDLQALVGADISTVSKHLSLMRAAGVLTCEKRGLNIYYRLACTCLGAFLRCLDELTPGEDACAVGCCD
ncbi:ArsR family transcriptional regulator [Prosthecobacter debontii]|uniref:ArsR family transcriptional regulator n=1 Tax=Prosthecobacter debontii TaxID=48467 RepID=A0A1T4Z5E1_9BACT|nr:metalloregulator ArsR/SmtB family transcription factor [Prosthecobacter debontii]SKB09078.1 ArsR family transcriptional regulator [Prosthecobacter debontii]